MSFDGEPLRALVGRLMAEDPEAGAALCVMVDGETVFDATWGMANAAEHRPYAPDSLQITMSVAKGVMGTLLALLVDQGRLDVAAPVSRYWPEFAAAGKRDVTVAQLFSHQAGLPLLDGGMSLALAADRDALGRALAAQPPLWEPGRQHGYHAVTLGCYADLLFERVTGKTMCGLLAEHAPRMGAEIYCGLPAQLAGRAVHLLPALPPAQAAAAPAPPPDPTSLPLRVLTNLPEAVAAPQQFLNGERIRSVCLPGTNMFSNARSLARLYAGLLQGGVWNGQALCSAEAIAEVTRERVRGTDLVNGTEMAYGLCFQLPCPFAPFSPNPAAFGHLGIGGAVAFGDPDTGLAMAWSPSRFSVNAYDARMAAVIGAVYAAL